MNKLQDVRSYTEPIKNDTLPDIIETEPIEPQVDIDAMLEKEIENKSVIKTEAEHRTLAFKRGQIVNLLA